MKVPMASLPAVGEGGATDFLPFSSQRPGSGMVSTVEALPLPFTTSAKEGEAVLEDAGENGVATGLRVRRGVVEGTGRGAHRWRGG
jgi:hypothetical protein